MTAIGVTARHLRAEAQLVLPRRDKRADHAVIVVRLAVVHYVQPEVVAVSIHIATQVVHRSGQAGRIEKLVHDFRIAHGYWISCDKGGALHPLVCKRLLPGFQVCSAYLTTIRHELSEAGLTTEGSLVEAIDVVASLLKLLLDEESCAHECLGVTEETRDSA